MSMDIQRRYSFSDESTPQDRPSWGPDAVCRCGVGQLNQRRFGLFVPRRTPVLISLTLAMQRVPNLARYHSKRPFMGEGFTPEAVMSSRVTEQVGSPHCLACSDEMHLTMIIPPVGNPYGLKVYACPKCGRSESYLVTVRSKAA